MYSLTPGHTERLRMLYMHFHYRLFISAISLEVIIPIALVAIGILICFCIGFARCLKRNPSHDTRTHSTTDSTDGYLTAQPPEYNEAIHSRPTVQTVTNLELTQVGTTPPPSYDTAVSGLFTLTPSSGCPTITMTSAIGVGVRGGRSPVTGEFPAQRASNVENVSVRWRHNASPPGKALELAQRQRCHDAKTCNHWLHRLCG